MVVVEKEKINTEERKQRKYLKRENLKNEDLKNILNEKIKLDNLFF